MEDTVPEGKAAAVRVGGLLARVAGWCTQGESAITAWTAAQGRLQPGELLVACARGEVTGHDFQFGRDRGQRRGARGS